MKTLYLAELTEEKQKEYLNKIATLMEKSGYSESDIAESLGIAEDSKVTDVLDTIAILRKEYRDARLHFYRFNG